MQTAGAGRPRRLDRLAVPAALRLGRLLRRAARRRPSTAAGSIAPAGPQARATPPLSATTRWCSRPSSDHRRGQRRADRLHAAARRAARRGAAGRGDRGRVPMRMELVIRFDYGWIVPWVRRLDDGLIGDRRARTPLCFDTPVDAPRRGAHAPWPSSRCRGRPRALRADLVSAPTGPSPRRPTPVAALDEHRALVATSGAGAARSRGPDRERGRRARSITLKALTYAPTGGIVAAPDDLAARAARRRAQLGLPLLLAARRRLHARTRCSRPATTTRPARGATGCCAPWPGSPRNMQIMYGLAGERRLTEYELDWLPGYEGVEPGADRQRAPRSSSSSTSTARSWTRCTRPRAAAWRPIDHAWHLQLALLEFLEGTGSEPDEGIWEVRGPPPPLHPLEGDGLGRLRPRRQGGRALRPRGPGRPLARRCASAIHDEVCDRGFDPEQGLVHPVLRLGPSSTPAC